MSVDAAGLSQPLLEAVKSMGYKQLTPIQQRAMPIIKKGEDLLASAQTGTGKTAAFMLPLIDKLLRKNDSNLFSTLILTPTRELAQQVAENITQFTQFTSLTSGVIYGGVNMPGQTKMLRQGVNILVATPGRLLEHMTLQHVNLSQVRTVVLDEADRMLDMGFLNDIERIFSTIKHQHQTLMFSATYSNKVKGLAKQVLHTPRTVEVAKQNATSGKVKQLVYRVSESRKRELLSELIGVNNWQQVLVFAGTKESANILAKELKLDGIKAALCHGDKSQGARNKALADFAEGKVRVLVATDVAARGLDIEDLQYVVNFHLPFLAEDYVHRIGRTGRAGKSGTAVSLVSPKDEKFLGNIEALIGRRFDYVTVPGYEFDPQADAKQNAETTKTSKNRYRTIQEKNQALAKKRAAGNKSSSAKSGQVKKTKKVKAKGKRK
ncbi:DEAD/DEAH box helicase [Thalassotalea fusca]